jgi:hypothetical protein
VLAKQQQRLVTAHAAPDGIDLPRVDSKPRQRGADDLRHAGEIVDLSSVTPGGKRQDPSHPAGADERKVSLRREVPPFARVDSGTDVAAVR